MDGFNWEVDGETIRIKFSLIENARWVDPDDEGRRDIVAFDYLDYEQIFVSSADLDLEESEYDRDLWNMLLQVTNLDAT